MVPAIEVEMCVCQAMLCNVNIDGKEWVVWYPECRPVLSSLRHLVVIQYTGQLIDRGIGDTC
jgi:hypothetical protein